MSDTLRVIGGANLKVGAGANRFDDCRSCNPWDPFTQHPEFPGQAAGYSLGLGGVEPLGRFRSGPLGMAKNQDEIQLTVLVLPWWHGHGNHVLRAVADSDDHASTSP